jgi:hypothetical protein
LGDDRFGNFPENFIARLARRGFQPFAALLDLHLPHRERHAEPLAQAAAESRPGIGVWTQAVVDVDRADRPAAAELVEKRD